MDTGGDEGGWNPYTVSAWIFIVAVLAALALLGQ